MTHVVTAFLRNRGEILLLRRSESVGTYRGRWGGVSGYVEGDCTDARREIREEVGVADAALVRGGEPLELVDDGREWIVHPFLFEVETREIDPNEEIAEWAWLPAPAMRARETVPGLWTAYEHVAPTVETVVEDTEHGSTWLSARALEALRDRAAVADDWATVAGVARELRDARPSMAALENRINRAMARACELEEPDRELDAAPRTPAAVVEAAQATLTDALDADAEAAANAAELLDSGKLGEAPAVLTLSRSETVTAALLAAEPTVLIGESRPAREGAETAERLDEAGLEVTLTTDAAATWSFAERESGPPAPDVALVGADAVQPDGSLVNKVGTRAIGLAATRAAVPLFAVAARDKIRARERTFQEHGEAGDVDSARRGLPVWNPIFDRTPADCVTGVVTEVGALDDAELATVVREQRLLADWPGSE